MLERLPPRREPRLLFLDARRSPVRYVLLDPFEVRALGALGARGASACLVRLALQLRPSHVAVVRHDDATPWGVARGLDALARRLQLVPLSPRDLERAIDAAANVDPREEYPELRHFARTADDAGALDAVRHARAVLLHHPLPPRRYAPRLAPHPTPRVARRGPHAHRPPPVP